jgi:uncharacterized membrane protein YbhN (UPF0104 family)
VRIRGMVLRVALGLVLVFWLLRKLDPAAVLGQLDGMTAAEVGRLFVPAVVMLLSATVNVGILLRALGQRPSWPVTLWVVHLSRSFGAVLPGRLGDLSLPPILQRRGVPLSTGAAVLALNKGVSFAVIVVAAGAACFFLIGDAALAVRVLAVGVLAAAAGLGALWAMNRIPMLHSVGRQLAHVPRRDPVALLGAVGVTTVSLALIAAAIRSPVGGTVVLPWHMVLGIHAIGMLVSQIPVSIGGLGVREAVVVSLFARIGADPARVAAAYLAMTAISLLVGGITLLVRLARRRRASS